MSSVKSVFILISSLTLIGSSFFVDYNDLSLANNSTPYIIMALSFLCMLLLVSIKPIKQQGKKILVINILECISSLYAVVYVIDICSSPHDIIKYLRLLPVGCAFLFAEMVRSNIKRQSEKR